MSGIAGWVDYERDLRGWRPAIVSMTATLACRGPDTEGVWLGPHAALGHRGLVVDGQGDVPQPFTGPGLPSGPVVAFDGALYDTGALRAELASHGHQFTGPGDAEVVLHAYLQWGERCPERLDGTFAFAVWDPRREELLLARDRLGLTPLHYYPTPHGVLFGSEPKAVLAHPLAEAVLDAEGLSELLTYAGSPDHGVFRGLRKVRAAHTVRVSRDAVAARRYWALSAREHADSLAETVGTVRELLLASVARQVKGGAPAGAMLSGGLDSSTMVAMMKRVAPDTPPLTYTVTFAGYAEQFTPDPFRGTPDAPYAADVVRHVGARHVDVVLGPGELTDPVARDAVLRAKDLPSMLGDMNVSGYLLCRAMRRDTAVAVSGEIADAVFGGNVYEGNQGDLGAAGSRIFPWMRLRHSKTGSLAMGGRLLDGDLLKRLNLFEYAADRCLAAHAETPLTAGLSPAERRARQDSYLQLTRWAENQFMHSERLSLAVGLQVRMPFADHRLFDYVFNVPAEMKRFDGREKSLLRAAVSDLLPGSVLHRPKSPFPVAIDPGYSAALREQLAGLRADPGAPAAPLLSASAITQRLAQWSERPAHWISRTDAEFVISLDAWLRRYAVRLAL